MGTEGVQMKVVLSWLVAMQEIFVLPWLLFLAQYKTFFPNRTLFQFIRSLSQQAGQAVVLGRLSLLVHIYYVCLCVNLFRVSFIS
jgi:hypothetical protein